MEFPDIAALLLLVAGPWAVAFAAPQFPALTGRVVDNANILSSQTEADLTAKLEKLETSTGRQLVVVTLPSLQGYEIEDYGYQLGRAWKIGRAAENDGTLLIVAPNERSVRGVVHRSCVESGRSDGARTLANPTSVRRC